MAFESIIKTSNDDKKMIKLLEDIDHSTYGIYRILENIEKLLEKGQ